MGLNPQYIINGYQQIACKKVCHILIIIYLFISSPGVTMLCDLCILIGKDGII